MMMKISPLSASRKKINFSISFQHYLFRILFIALINLTVLAEEVLFLCLEQPESAGQPY